MGILRWGKMTENVLWCYEKNRTTNLELMAIEWSEKPWGISYTEGSVWVSQVLFLTSLLPFPVGKNPPTTTHHTSSPWSLWLRLTLSSHHQLVSQCFLSLVSLPLEHDLRHVGIAKPLKLIPRVHMETAREKGPLNTPEIVCLVEYEAEHLQPGNT